MAKINETIMQYFEWYLKPEDNLWNLCVRNAHYLSSIGITHIWLPPAYKGSGGENDVGYGVYDLYDLGEFNQKGSIRTKYGTKQEYLDCIKALKGNNINVIADIVLNHKLGSDGTEEVIAIEDDPHNRTRCISEPKPILAWTKYLFEGRNNMYSDFKWNWTHFHGVDWDDMEKKNSIYIFYGKHWDDNVDKENGNYDYLMGSDVDFNNLDVRAELNKWGKWYLDTTNVDGFRLDAVKHIRADFFEEWLTNLRNKAGKKLFTVGEYWSTNVNALNYYISETKEVMSLFDVPLHYNFYQACNSSGTFDMSKIFDGTLTKSNPDKSITFVDNHDTQIGQSLQSWIHEWFKPLAYSLILLRKEGIPCVFYGDYYGIPEKNVKPMKDILEVLLWARKYFAYGIQNDYFDHHDIIGWTREGDYEHPDSGMAVLLTDGPGGSKQMNVGKNLSGTILYDCTR